jgi:hypothetical protein
MLNPKECGHDGDPKIENFTINSGKNNQEVFFLARCEKCNTIFSVTPKLFLEREFSAINKALFEIKGTLADIRRNTQKPGSPIQP